MFTVHTKEELSSWDGLIVSIFVFPLKWFTPVFYEKPALTVTGLHFNNKTVLKVNLWCIIITLFQCLINP